MKRLVLPLAALALAVTPPQPSAAATVDDIKLKKCMDEAIASCNRDFPGTDYISISIRGWCYTIRTALCYLIDPEA